MNNSTQMRNMFLSVFICASLMLLTSGGRDSCGYDVCNSDLCSRVRCRTFPKDDCKGSVWVADGKCGCCDGCIIPLELGAKCNTSASFSLSNPEPYCRSGLTCDCKMKKCVRCPDC
uniref:U2-Liphistoxin-Lm1a_1 n=1 Tax=Liphistius malayanus TaxID=1203467 RepID=A0A482ZAH5_9ARAC